MDPSAKSHTLRPYQHRRDEMTFFATTPSTANTSTRGGAAPDGMSLQLPSKPANRYMSAEGDAALGLEYERATPGAFIKGLLVSGALQYTSTCLAMPFEIGKLLLQVQWVPREEVWRQMHAPMRPLVQKSPAEDEEETDSVDPWAESARCVGRGGRGRGRRAGQVLPRSLRAVSRRHRGSAAHEAHRLERIRYAAWAA